MSKPSDDWWDRFSELATEAVNEEGGVLEGVKQMLLELASHIEWQDETELNGSKKSRAYLALAAKINKLANSIQTDS